VGITVVLLPKGLLCKKNGRFGIKKETCSSTILAGKLPTFILIVDVLFKLRCFCLTGTPTRIQCSNSLQLIL